MADLLTEITPEELRQQFAPSKKTLMKIVAAIFVFVSAGGHYCIIHGVPLFLLHPEHGFFFFHYNRRSQFILEGLIMALFTAAMSAAFIFMTYHAGPMARKASTRNAAYRRLSADRKKQISEETNYAIWISVAILFFGFLKYMSSFSSRIPGYPVLRMLILIMLPLVMLSLLLVLPLLSSSDVFFDSGHEHEMRHRRTEHEKERRLSENRYGKYKTSEEMTEPSVKRAGSNRRLHKNALRRR